MSARVLEQPSCGLASLRVPLQTDLEAGKHDGRQCRGRPTSLKLQPRGTMERLRREMDMERIAILEVDVRVAATGMRASRLMGADVYNDGDEHIGTLDDLMIGDDGTVGFAILSVGGFLGIGSRLVAVTFGSLTIDDYRVVLPGATREELKRLPEFDYS
jgi:hypothetical protein